MSSKLNNYLLVLISCISMFSVSFSYRDLQLHQYQRHKDSIAAPFIIFYNKGDFMQAKVVIENIPKGNVDYIYSVYNAEQVFSQGTLTGQEIEINDGFTSSSNDYIYYIKLGTNDGLQCEPVRMITAVHSDADLRNKKPCLEKKRCNIIVDLKNICEREKYDLRIEVVSPKLKYTDDGVLRYSLGDKLILLCSERTKNKHIYLHWHTRKNVYNESVNWGNNTILYDLYYEMDLKRFDSGTFVYCSATNSSGKVVQTSSYINLHLLRDTDVIDNMLTVFLENGVTSVAFDCGQDYKKLQNVANGSMLHCLSYTKQYRVVGKESRYVIIRNTYNETIYYLHQKEAQNLSSDSMIGLSVAIVLTTIAMVVCTLYRRRLGGDNIHSTVTYSSANEVVYAQLQMPENTSTRPRVELDASPYAQVIGVLTTKKPEL